MHRETFALGEGIYLLNHSVGRPPRSAESAAKTGFFEPWQTGDVEPWEPWFAEVDRFRAAVAALLGSASDNVCPQANLSSALTKIVHALPRRVGRDTIVYTEADFPSMGFVLAMAGRAGFRLRCIPDTADFGSLECWESTLDDDCCLALITHVHSNTSRQVPVADICRLARDREVMTVVDVAQSAGIVPIDAGAWDADFIVGSCVKFLCGGPGAGFLWVNDRVLHECQPTDVGWFSHDDPFEFDIHEFRYAESALRFWGGTPAVLPYAVAANSLETLIDIGIERIRAHSLELTQTIINSVPRKVLFTPARPASRGGTVVLDFGEQRSAAIHALAEAGVHFDARRTGMRLSPHVYTSKEEIETVISCLAPFARSAV
jgi:selenocysteine lyase/cysteine desulfurase